MIGAMNTAELIYEKARSLPNDKQDEALRFVDFLLARGSAQTEAAEWRKLLRETQSAPGVADLTDEDIAREMAAAPTVCKKERTATGQLKRPCLT